MGADVTLNFKNCDVIDEIMKITGGRGADSAIEALGTQATFESALRCIKPGGTLSSLGVYSEDLKIPLSAFAAGLGDHKINTALCPGGKERMRRLMNVVASNRLDLGLLVTHQYKLDDIVAAYDLFAHQRDGVLKVAIKPQIRHRVARAAKALAHAHQKKPSSICCQGFLHEVVTGACYFPTRSLSLPASNCSLSAASSGTQSPVLTQADSFSMACHSKAIWCSCEEALSIRPRIACDGGRLPG